MHYGHILAFGLAAVRHSRLWPIEEGECLLPALLFNLSSISLLMAQPAAPSAAHRQLLLKLHIFYYNLLK